MSIVEFAEKLLGCKLLDWQKELLNKYYECISQNKQLHYIPSRGNVKRMPILLQYIAMTYYFNESDHLVMTDIRKEKNK